MKSFAFLLWLQFRQVPLYDVNLKDSLVLLWRQLGRLLSYLTSVDSLNLHWRNSSWNPHFPELVVLLQRPVDYDHSLLWAQSQWEVKKQRETHFCHPMKSCRNTSPDDSAFLPVRMTEVDCMLQESVANFCISTCFFSDYGGLEMRRWTCVYAKCDSPGSSPSLRLQWYLLWKNSYCSSR